MELTSVKSIKELSNMFGFDFSKGLGQNFLTDQSVLEDIAKAAAGVENVLEIGPGFGVLTKELSKNFKKVVSVEIDKSLLKVLDFTLSECKNVKIINNDFLKVNVNKLIEEEFNSEKISVAANLPYYITTPIVTELIEKRYDISNIVVMVQKEVAKRFCAKPGTKDCGAISAAINYYSEPEKLFDVSKGNFVPPPNVTSAVIRLTLRKEPPVKVSDEKHFFKIVKNSFRL